jgi:four helix bundle protein
MDKITSFEDLDCWKEARTLVRIVHMMSEDGLIAKSYDFRSQIRRASISVMNNIAEGFSRYSTKEKIRFFEMSAASAMEVKSMSYSGLDLHYFSEAGAREVKERAEKIRALDLGFIKYLKNRPPLSQDPDTSRQKRKDVNP